MEDDPDKIDTPKEIAAFEDFERRWNAIIAEAESRDWIEYYGYDPAPSPYHPSRRESARLEERRQRQRAEERRSEEEKKRQKSQLFEKEKAKLRERIYGK